ncbi:phosphotransferase family protein [Micromonospora sp. NPDC005203]|uniref:phosphotransferase family protein n=1 Tax=Micromonospora sp. NPDC005203 TaxID=3364226 RepID=UPI0036999CFC
MTWSDIYERARTRLDAAAGYYNHNVRVDLSTESVIVRIPIEGADVMDLRLWREQELLPAIAPYVARAPRLVFLSTAPPFQIHEFIEGAVLNDIAPRGVPCPRHVLSDVAELFLQLVDVPRDALPPIPDEWPADADSAAFARRLTSLTQWVYDAFAERYRPLFARFEIPDQPLACLTEIWPTLTARPSVCVHADVHRKNIIVNEGGSVFLDWELALWGDPVYDMAVHLHKMEYVDDERNELLSRWSARMPPQHVAGWQSDLRAYLSHEQIKSAIVDTVRYSQLFVADGPWPYAKATMLESLKAKLNAARPHWGISTRITIDEVESALNDWVQGADTRLGSGVSRDRHQ